MRRWKLIYREQRKRMTKALGYLISSQAENGHSCEGKDLSGEILPAGKG